MYKEPLTLETQVCNCYERASKPDPKLPWARSLPHLRIELLPGGVSLSVMDGPAAVSTVIPYDDLIYANIAIIEAAYDRAVNLLFDYERRKKEQMTADTIEFFSSQGWTYAPLPKGDVKFMVGSAS